MTCTLAVNVLGDELEATADFCRTEGIGIEVTDFAFPDNLTGDMTKCIERHRQAVVDIAPVSSHGPFMELIATSRDPLIIEVARQRHTAALNAARAIGAGFYIAHMNFNPLIHDRRHTKRFNRCMLDFWLPLADIAAKHDTVICLENIWEPCPEIQANLISAAGHPNLKASFDNGHALVYSDQTAATWIETLGDALAHCHLHDNSGHADEHKAIGDGIEDWPALIAAVRSCAPAALLVAESDRLDLNRLSLQKLRQM